MHAQQQFAHVVKSCVGLHNLTPTRLAQEAFRRAPGCAWTPDVVAEWFGKESPVTNRVAERATQKSREIPFEAKKGGERKEGRTR